MTCSKKNTQKYLTRKSPPYSAQDCPEKTKTGNDGEKYKSVAASNGVYRWKKITSAKKSSRRTSAKKSS